MNSEIEKQISESSLAENATRAINVIIRPPRSNYNITDVTNVYISTDIPPVPRIPISFRNRKGLTIVGSFYISGSYNTEEKHQCVIYLHGNVGSQLEGRFLVPYLCPRGICVFCFDFSGSGLSGGEYVTLGYNEHVDVIDACNFLNAQWHIQDFVLWGRSMGAACAVMAGQQHPLIRGIIVDSAYSSLTELFAAISAQTPLPSFIRPIAVKWIKHEVKKRALFNCNDVRPVDWAEKAVVPLFLGHCTDDDFVPYDLGRMIYEHYACEDKEMMTMTGGHNGRRDPSWIMKCLRFILRVFGLPFVYFEVAITSETVQHVASFADLMAQAPTTAA